jgi:hypothetical protein
MWDGLLHAYGAVMQFSADPFDIGPARRVMPGRPSRGPTAVLALVLIVIVSALTAEADGLPSGQRASEQRLNENKAAPTEVIDAFLTAQRGGDAEAAAALFERDAVVTDASGQPARGTDAVRRLIERLNGWEAGARQANGDEVIWAESLPNWQPSAVSTDLELRLQQEVPHYAVTRWMCAVITDGKIHAVTALAVDGERSCETAEPTPGTRFPWMPAVAAMVAALACLVQRAPQQPTTGGRPFIDALRAWHRARGGTES